MSTRMPEARRHMADAAGYLQGIGILEDEGERLAQERVNRLLDQARDMRVQGRRRTASRLENRARAIATAWGGEI